MCIRDRLSICAGAFRMLASLPLPPPEGACVLTGCIADAPRTEGGFTYATLYDAACNGDSVRGRIQIRFPAEKAKGLKGGDIISSEAALRIPQKEAGSFDARAYYPVSYTHLDVYKSQSQFRLACAPRRARQACHDFPGRANASPARLLFRPSSPFEYHSKAKTGPLACLMPVSYTHLDVYKRQKLSITAILPCLLASSTSLCVTQKEK